MPASGLPRPAGPGSARRSAGWSISCRPGRRATPRGAALMTAAGIAWGVYSIRGRRPVDPVAATAGNFLRAAPLALALSVALAARLHVTPAGLALAALSGALTSGLGYVVWYAALRHSRRCAPRRFSCPSRPSPRAAPCCSCPNSQPGGSRSHRPRSSAASRPCSRRGRGGRAARGDARQARHPTHSSGQNAKPAHGYRARVLDETANRAPARCLA